MPKETLKALVEVASTKETMKSFLEAFRVAVEHMAELKLASKAEMAKMMKMCDQSLKDLKDKNSTDTRDLKNSLDKQFGTLFAQNEKALNYMRDWVRNLPLAKDGAKGDKGDTGPTGKDGKDGKDGVDGKDGERGPAGATGRALFGTGRQDNWHTGNRETMQKLSVSATAPAKPNINDLWCDTS